MASITRTPGGTQKLLEGVKALLTEVRDLDKFAQMRRYDIIDTLRGIGHVLQTEDPLDEFKAWDVLGEYELTEHELDA
tara:strand:- start:1187 stop:1420 length:234 start_codon:yes stop_codon:yes gene_type:complete